MIRFAALALCLAGAAPVWAFEPAMPASARALSERVSEDDYTLPAGPWVDGAMETLRIEGEVRRRTWRVEDGSTTGQILNRLTDQLLSAGYAPIFSCSTRDCGGFDFRFAIDVVPAPDMFVDLSDFRFLSAVNGAGDGLALLVGGGRGSAWVQLTEITRRTPHAPEDLARALEETGRLVLDDVVFETGAALDPAPIPALAVLAAYLADHPEARLAIVAHSDRPADGDTSRAEGLAEARSVRARLIAEHDADPTRVEALWLGPFAPRATPLNAVGRRVNRRIEAVLLP